MTERLTADETGLARAAALLAEGRLVAFPTETVYGLGADATNADAVARIYEAKGRPRFNPLIAHVASLEAARALVRFDAASEALAHAFWPGPMTLVLPLSGAPVADLVTAGLPTLAVRVPEAPLARDLLARVGRPIAAPSANPSGRVSPTTADHVMEGLSGRIDAVLDGGPCGVGVESTILMPEDDGVRVLRPGGLPAEALEPIFGTKISHGTLEGTPNAPGQLASHYAPGGTVRLNAEGPEAGETFLGFGPMEADLTLSETGDLREAAANLFGALQTLDRMGAARIAVAPIPERGLGRAINDRLRRAAAPR